MQPGRNCAGASAAIASLTFHPRLAPGSGDRPVELHSPLGSLPPWPRTCSSNTPKAWMRPKWAGAAWTFTSCASFCSFTPPARTSTAPHQLYCPRAVFQSALSHSQVDAAGGRRAVPCLARLPSPDDRLFILVGHDTNLANIAGALDLNWLIDGRRDDTPPGGALVFELWKSRSTGEVFGAHLLHRANPRPDAQRRAAQPAESSRARAGLRARVRPGRLIL